MRTKIAKLYDYNPDVLPTPTLNQPYHNKLNAFWSHFDIDGSLKNSYPNSDAQKHLIKFIPLFLPQNPNQSVIGGNVIEYDKNGIVVRYEVKNNEVKETVTLPNVLNQIEYQIETDGFTYSDPYYFFSDKGMFNILDAIAIDSNQLTTELIPTYDPVTKILKFAFPQDFIDNAVPPISVDPTLIGSGGFSQDGGHTIAWTSSGDIYVHYVNGGQSVVARSNDGGTTWSTIFQGGSGHDRPHIVVDLNDNIYIFYSRSTFMATRRSQDAYAIERTIFNFSGGVKAQDSSCDSIDQLYVTGTRMSGTNAPTFNRSTDQGVTWPNWFTDVNAPRGPIRMQTYQVTAGVGHIWCRTRALAGNPFWIQTGTVIRLNTSGNINHTSSPSLAQSPNNIDILLACITWGGPGYPRVWRSVDGGINWVLVGDTQTTINCTNMQVDFQTLSDGTIILYFISLAGDMYRQDSVDDGLTWSAPVLLHPAVVISALHKPPIQALPTVPMYVYQDGGSVFFNSISQVGQIIGPF